MDTCRTHDIELFEAMDGTLFCPSCEAEEVERGLERGEYQKTTGQPDFYIPALGKEATETLKQMTIRFPTRDIERARVLAKSRKMPYQSYIKRLLTEALDQEEKHFLGKRVGGE